MLIALSAPILWVVVSLVLGIILLPLQRRIAPAKYEIFELGRWVLVPYLALLLGNISPRLMGLTNQDWVTTFGVGLVLSFGLLVLAAIAKVTNHAVSAEFFTNADQTTNISLYRDSLLVQPANIQPANVEPALWVWMSVRASMQEFHWAFLRASIWEALLRMPTPLELPAYTALWIAGVAVITEILIHGRRDQWIGYFVTFLFTSVLFLYTRNFYLCCLLHIGMAFLLPQALPTPLSKIKASKIKA